MRRVTLFLLTLALAPAPALATTPIAEVLCKPAGQMRDTLTQRFGSSRRATGLRGPEQMMELWSSERSGDWTLVISYADGKSCIVAMGQHLEIARPARDAG